MPVRASSSLPHLRFQCPTTATFFATLCHLPFPDCPHPAPPPPQAYLRSIASHPLLQRSETLKVFLLQPGDLSRNPAWLMLSAAHAPKRFGKASSVLPSLISLVIQQLSCCHLHCWGLK